MSKAWGGLLKKVAQVGKKLDQEFTVDGAKPSGLNSNDPQKREAAENTFITPLVTPIKNVFAGLGMQPIGAEGNESKPVETPQNPVATEIPPQVAIEVQQPLEPVLQEQAEPEKPVVVNNPVAVVLPDPVPVNHNPQVQEVKIENPINAVETQGDELPENDQSNQQAVVTTEGDQNPAIEKKERGNSDVALEKHEEKSIIPTTAKPISEQDIKDITMEGLYLHCTINPENNNEILHFQFYYDEPKQEETTTLTGFSLEVDSTNT